MHASCCENIRAGTAANAPNFTGGNTAPRELKLQRFKRKRQAVQAKRRGERHHQPAEKGKRLVTDKKSLQLLLLLLLLAVRSRTGNTLGLDPKMAFLCSGPHLRTALRSYYFMYTSQETRRK